MTGAPIWRLEWRLALRRRRLFVLNLAIPLVLVLPLALGSAPPFHAAAAYAVLFVLFGVFGSAIPLIRDGEGGLLRRMLLAGAPEARILGERVLAGAVLDTLQLLPALGVILAVGRAPGAAWFVAPSVLLLTLLAANLIGVWVAALARSLAEGALFAAVVALFLLHGSGVFRTAREGTVGALLQETLPFGPLHQTLLAAAGGGPPPSIGWSLLVPAVGSMLILGLTLFFAGILLERVAPGVRGDGRGG
jgi:ABC-type transport system involved in cytochrome c biogenesis permease component